jgi:hypothetical protein
MGLPHSVAQANASGVAFLLVELDTALTFMDVAGASRIAETVRRNRENALEAYRTVQRFLPRVKPNAAQRKVLNEKLAVLKARLQESGLVV